MLLISPLTLEPFEEGTLTNTVSRKHGDGIPNSVRAKECHHIAFGKSKFMNQRSGDLCGIVLNQIISNSLLRSGICEASNIRGFLYAERRS